MKIGVRKPSIKRSIKARTTGRAKRAVKRAVISGYGRKGSGWVKNPKKAAYNAVYSRTTVSVCDLGKTKTRRKRNMSGNYSGDFSVQTDNRPYYRDNKILIACILGGWFGLHRYMRGQIGMGILYTMTVGLFCFGWFIDIFKEVSRPAKPEHIERPGRPKAAVHTDEVVKMSMDRKMEILNDCARIIKTTDNPDVFFSRYALYSDTLKELADAELAGIKFEGDSPLNKQITVLNDKEKTNTTNEMIVRYYNKIVNKIKTLKTDSAKSNNAIKFRETLEQYDEFMTEESITYYRNIATKLENDSYSLHSNVKSKEDYSWIKDNPECRKQL